MVIDSNNSIKNTGTSTSGSRNSSAVGTDKRADQSGKGSENAKSNDRVVLSQEAQSLKRLQGAINELPDVNSERVESIRQAIAEGKFSINAERIAENMLRQDELLG